MCSGQGGARIGYIIIYCLFVGLFVFFFFFFLERVVVEEEEKKRLP